jgi:site-specific recombinase XerD
MDRQGFVAGSLYTRSGQRKYLTASERTRFIEAANACPRTEIRTLCLTMIYTGFRISEALSVVAGSVQKAEGVIAVRCLKKRRGNVVVREVPVPFDLLDTLEEAHGLSAQPRNARLWTFCRSRAWQLVKAVMADAQISQGPHATPKGLRHGFGVHAIRSGVPLNFVQRWLGHASMTTTAIYLQAIGEEERAIAARMWALA